MSYLRHSFGIWRQKWRVMNWTKHRIVATKRMWITKCFNAIACAVKVRASLQLDVNTYSSILYTTHICTVCIVHFFTCQYITNLCNIVNTCQHTWVYTVSICRTVQHAHQELTASTAVFILYCVRVQARSAEKALTIGKAALVFRMALAARAFRAWQMNWDRAVRAKKLLLRVHRGPAFQAWYQVLPYTYCAREITILHVKTRCMVTRL
jgi:hypothetical protein